MNLGDNQLTTLPESIGNLKSLKELYLEGNELTTLPESIGNLKSLKELYLRNNKLTALPESLGGLDNLKTLYLAGNPLSGKELKVYKKGARAVVEYCKNKLLEKEKRRLEEERRKKEEEERRKKEEEERRKKEMAQAQKRFELLKKNIDILKNNVIGARERGNYLDAIKNWEHAISVLEKARVELQKFDPSSVTQLDKQIQDGQKELAIYKEELLIKNTIGYIKQISGIYEEITIEKIQENTSCDIKNIESLIIDLVSRGEIQAKIKGNVIIFRGVGTTQIAAPKILRGFNVAGDAFKFFIKIENLTTFLLNNVNVKIILPDTLKFDEKRSSETYH
ncbi:MAG: leucine-rich repeat domain-containing protein, partial [Candidatus Helarchaeota archaeon]